VPWHERAAAAECRSACRCLIERKGHRRPDFGARSQGRQHLDDGRHHCGRKSANATESVRLLPNAEAPATSRRASEVPQEILPKTFCQKNRVETNLQKIRPKVQNRLFLDFFYHVFGRFSVRGVHKHDKITTTKINLTLILFWPLTHPPTTGVTDFCFIGGPLIPGATTARSKICFTHFFCFCFEFAGRAH
jgi:hypothetical protein